MSFTRVLKAALAFLCFACIFLSCGEARDIIPSSMIPPKSSPRAKVHPIQQGARNPGITEYQPRPGVVCWILADGRFQRQVQAVALDCEFIPGWEPGAPQKLEKTSETGG